VREYIKKDNYGLKEEVETKASNFWLDLEK